MLQGIANCPLKNYNMLNQKKKQKKKKKKIQCKANVLLLPPASHDLLRALSPSSVVDSLDARIYLMQTNTSDQYVPFTESRDFDAALTRLGCSHEFVELGGFQHVEVRSGATPGEWSVTARISSPSSTSRR